MITKLIYPGHRSLVVKRLCHTLVLSCIALNLYIQKLENLMVNMAVELSGDVVSIAPKSSTIEVVMTPAIEAVRKIQNSKVGRGIVASYLPSADTLQKYRDTSVRLVNRSTRVKPIMRQGAMILNVISILACVSILYSAFWMWCDINRGQSKLQAVTFLLVSMIINIYSYRWLAQYWQKFELF